MILENRHTGERLALRRLTIDGETCLEIRGSLPPRNQGPPLHVHHHELEEGRVTAGTLSALIDGRRVTARAGDAVTIPKGASHRWWNDGDETLVFVGYVRPVVDLDRYLHAMFEIANASPAGRPSLFYVAHTARRHRRTQAVLVLPPVLQAVAFRVIVAVGTLLGRYRGDDWPGCPSRCSEAPVTNGDAA